MKITAHVLVITFLTFLLVAGLSAQSNAAIEKDLVSKLNEVQKWSDYGSNYDEEKLASANKVFEAKLVEYTKVPTTLKFAFPDLGKLLTIASSEDGKLRIYSWDMETGGTMHEYSRVYQYIGSDGATYSRPESDIEDEDAGSFAYSIFTQPTKTGAIYSVCSTAILSNPDHYQAVGLYKIDGVELKDKVKLFKTQEGLTNSIGFEYDAFSVIDRKERPIRLIVFDRRTRSIKIPIVIIEKNTPLGRVTDRFITYKFDGTYFVKIS